MQLSPKRELNHVCPAWIMYSQAPPQPTKNFTAQKFPDHPSSTVEVNWTGWHFVYIYSDLPLKPLPLKGTFICIKYTGLKYALKGTKFLPLKGTIHYQGSHFFPNTKFQVFSRFLVLNSRYFHTNFSYKNLKCVKNRCRVPTSLVTENSMYFPGKSNEI